MKFKYKVTVIVIALSLFFSFTAFSWYSEPKTIGLSPEDTPYNQLAAYMYNNSNYDYKVGYLNFSEYGNSVSYVYVVLPLEGYKVVSVNYTGPFLYFSLFKVSQKTAFPFTNTSLLVKIQFHPSTYLIPSKAGLVPDIMPYSINSLVQGSFANQGVEPGNMTLWVNVTVTPVFNIGPYHISGGTKTLPFQFNVIISNTTKL